MAVEVTHSRIVVSCPWCGSGDSEAILSGRDHHTGEAGFSVARCRSCALLYTRVRPPDADLGRFYPSEYHEGLAPAGAGQPSRRGAAILHAVFGYPGGDEGPIARRLARAAAAVTRRDASRLPWVPGGRLLEVGSGRGAVLAQYRALGWDVLGVEPASRGRELAHLAGLEVRGGLLEDQGFPAASFDAVVLNHVLEHVPAPGDLLLEVRRVLRPGGWLLTRVPNGASWEARLYGEYWSPWELPRHLTHFSPRTLRMMLAGSGFEVIRVRTELRPSNLGLNARWAVRQRWRRAIDARLAAALLLPLGAAAAWSGHGSDLAALARVPLGDGSPSGAGDEGSAERPLMATVAQ